MLKLTWIINALEVFQLPFFVN